MIRLKKILFPTDFSDRGRGAARAVSALARRFEAEVMVLHVVECASAERIADNYLKQARTKIKKLIAGELTGCNAVPCITTGDPAVRIVEIARAEGFDLIMMPTHGYGPFRQFLLGSVTAKVLHDASCPVWTSAHLEDWPAIESLTLRTVLCGIDFGPRSTSALKYASQVATEFGANLTAVHAMPLFETLAWSRDCRDQTVKAAEEKVRRIEAELEVRAPVEIMDASPAYGLREVADSLNADLVIIGRTHVAEGAKLGSNACAIIAHSRCPVLSV